MSMEEFDISLEEKNFLDNLTRFMADKQFVAQVINESRKNPNRENYPSIDLGSYDDAEHGLLFGAQNHVMIDPFLSPEVSVQMISRLKDYGAKISQVSQHENIRKVEYSVGGTNRVIELVTADADKLDKELEERIRRGISSLIMKGMGGFKGQDGYTDLIGVLEKYIQFLQVDGLLLSGVTPQTKFKKIGQGNLPYWVHSSQDYRLSPHGLYLKK